MPVQRIGITLRVLILVATAGAQGILFPMPGHAQDPGQNQPAAHAGNLQNEQEWRVIAISPGVQVTLEKFSEPGKVLPSGQNPLDVAQNWLAGKRLSEGRNQIDGKLLYVSIGKATVNARPSDTGYIDSRYLAFQRAELDAKAKTAIFLGVDLTTERGSSERTINPQERSELEAIVKASPTLEKNATTMEVMDTIYELFQKAKVLAGAKLDQQIRKTGEDVSATQREAEQKLAARQERRTKIGNLRNISEASIKAAASAFADVQGAQTIQVFEGSYHGGYQVVVVTLWSHNMQRLVQSMQSGRAPMGLSSARAKEEIARQLPVDANELACLTGVRAYINEKGEHVLLAFGQAGVEVIGGRKDKAFEMADRKARLRAMAAMRTFMGERLAFDVTEDMMEVLALYADEYSEQGAEEYKSISQFQESIQAFASKQEITGIHSLMTKELTHPFTDKPLVLKIMSWSPASQDMSQQLQEAIRHKPESARPAPSAGASGRPTQEPAREGMISSGEGADKDAW